MRWIHENVVPASHVLHCTLDWEQEHAGQPGSEARVTSSGVTAPVYSSLAARDCNVGTRASAFSVQWADPSCNCLALTKQTDAKPFRPRLQLTPRIDRVLN